MPDENSPAVKSLAQEQAAQSVANNDSSLDGGLKSTFPASDPVSATETSIPSGVASQSLIRPSNEAAATPLVDEALASIRDRRELPFVSTASPSAEIDAMRKEVARMMESTREIGRASIRVATAEGGNLIDQLESGIRTRPLATVGIAAALGYFWGLRH